MAMRHIFCWSRPAYTGFISLHPSLMYCELMYCDVNWLVLRVFADRALGFDSSELALAWWFRGKSLEHWPNVEYPQIVCTKWRMRWSVWGVEVRRVGPCGLDSYDGRSYKVARVKHLTNWRTTYAIVGRTYCLVCCKGLCAASPW
jgi:hypothetical protein